VFNLNSRVNFNEIKFTIARFDKELHNALPNSVRAENDLLQFALFSKSYFYKKNSGNSIKIYDNLTNTNLTGKKFTIFPLSYKDIFNSNSSLQKIYTVNSVVKNADNSWTLTFNKNIISDSPYHRCYLIDTPVTIFKKNDKLIRCFGYEINGSDGKNEGTCNIMTNYVINASFDYSAGTALKDGILKISLTFSKKDVTLNYKHEVHFRNVP
jgi:MSHA biogenesis protein MshO